MQPVWQIATAAQRKRAIDRFTVIARISPSASAVRFCTNSITAAIRGFGA
jgi:hypothetical protein